MARDYDDVIFNGNPDKKVKKKNKNHVHIKGHDLELGDGETLQVINMVSTMASGAVVTWTNISSIDVSENGKHVRFYADLPEFLSPTASSKSKGKKTNGGESGDITFTLDYSSSDDLPVDCPDIEHEEP